MDKPARGRPTKDSEALMEARAQLALLRGAYTRYMLMTAESSKTRTLLSNWHWRGVEADKVERAERLRLMKAVGQSRLPS